MRLGEHSRLERNGRPSGESRHGRLPGGRDRTYLKLDGKNRAQKQRQLATFLCSRRWRLDDGEIKLSKV